MRLSCNVGPLERYARLGLGVGFGAAALSRRRGRAARLLLAVAAAAGVATAWTRYCPLNAALGLHPCRAAEGRERTAPELPRPARIGAS